MRLFLLLLIVPLIEIALFVELGGAIGLAATLVIVALTALAGAALMRSQGLQIFNDLRHAAHRGSSPSETILHGFLVICAGLLLLTPGFFTDAVGFALLAPAVRRSLISWGARAVATGIAARFSFPGDGRDIIIEGTARSVNPQQEGFETRSND